MAPKILVTGITGGLGRSVLETLLQHVPPSSLAASSSNRAAADRLQGKGVEFRWVDYNVPESLHEAFKGIEKLFFVSSSEINAEKRTAQHANVVEAAKATGIKHVCSDASNLIPMLNGILLMLPPRSTTAPSHSADMAPGPRS